MRSAKLILIIGAVIAIAAWVLVLSSCTLTIAADGSKSATVDGAALYQILKDK